MATHGSIEEFSGTGWASWSERLQFYFEANGISEDARKRAVLLTLCGPSTYETVRALVAPQKPSEVPFEEIVSRLRDHFDPRPSELYSRCRFQQRDQLPGESITAYVAALKTLAAQCNFGTPVLADASQGDGSRPQTTMLPLDVMLRDRFVCGLQDAYLQQRLFAENDLTFQKALDISLRAESAKLQQQSIKGSVSEVNKTGAKVPGRNSAAQQTSDKRCYRCDEHHSPDSCAHRASRCRFCRKVGHIEKACIKKKARDKARPHSGILHTVLPPCTCDTEPCHQAQCYDLNHLFTASVPQKHLVELQVHGVNLVFEVDSGASHSIISEDTFRRAWPNKPPSLLDTPVALRTWSGEGLQALGTAVVEVQFKNTTQSLPLVIMKTPGCNLLGRNWFEPLGISIHGINLLACDSSIKAILERFGSVFDDNLNEYKGPLVKLELKDSVSPKFLRARPVPFALKERVEEEIDRLTRQGIIEPIQHSEWATPVVIILKKDGSIRLCGDYRSTVNEASTKASYPLPTVSEVLAKLEGGKIFSTLDLTQAYQQLKVTDEAAAILTINTSKGLYRVKRLPFGISAAPAIFQRCMETTLAGIKGVCAYLDDIIVTGSTQEEHNERLGLVLARLQAQGLRAKMSKCRFGLPEVVYLGHRIDAKGISATDEKIKAIKELPEPTSKATLQSFLGMISFYDRFLEHRATIANELYQLLAKNVPWRWEAKHAAAFKRLKQLVLQKTVLAHYDSSKPLILSCDASPYGIGAVLAQKDSQGREAPIAFASRTLGPAERNYSQLDREGLAVVFGAIHFHQYLAGRHVIIYTDHQPLLGLLSPGKPVPAVVSPRMKRWCIKLAAYDYELAYRPGKCHQNADVLSRLPLSSTDDEPWPPADVLMTEALPNPPLSAQKIALLTQEDPTLRQVYNAVQKGRIRDITADSFKPFRKKDAELSTLRGCLLWGSRVVIPTVVRPEVLKLIHAGHRGVVAMKAVARSYVWWPAIDRDIERTAAECIQCQQSRRDDARTLLPNWEHPSRPWQTLHLDFAGPLEGRMFLVIVDAYTKWLEVRCVPNATSATVILELRRLFATFGIPEKLVTDNGTAFVSAEMTTFCQRNGIRKITSAPYHPATNGQAERMVYELKLALAREKSTDINLRLARFLFKQHSTVSSSTGKSPAQLMLGREFRTNLQLLVPTRPKLHPAHSETLKKDWQPQQQVFARNFGNGPRWIPGVLLERKGLRSWLVQTDTGPVRRHLNHLRVRRMEYPGQPSSLPMPLALDTPNPELTRNERLDAEDSTTAGSTSGEQLSPGKAACPQPALQRRTNPPRNRRPPARYRDSN